MRRFDLGSVTVVIACAAVVTNGCGGGSSSGPAPAPTPRAAAVSVLSVTARTESDGGSLAYPVTFQVRESAGVAATVSNVVLTLSGGGGTGTTTVAGDEALTTARLAAGATVQSNAIRMRTSSSTQATQVLVRVAFNDDSGNAGNAESSANVVALSGGGPPPAPAPPSSWPPPLPPRSGSRPVCQAPLPSVASCVNDITGPPQAICNDGRYSCSTGSGTCSGHGGVYCWRN
jgi:hypothetical protein